MGFLFFIFHVIRDLACATAVHIPFVIASGSIPSMGGWLRALRFDPQFLLYTQTPVCIPFTLLCPGAGTAGMAKLAPGPGGAAAMQEVVTSSIPLGRMGTKWDIAMACVYLASPAGRYLQK